MSSANDYPELPPVEKERGERREKKRRPQWNISGRSVLTLVRIIKKRVKSKKPRGPVKRRFR